MLTDIQYKTVCTACQILEDTRSYDQELLITYDDFMDEAEEQTEFTDDLTKEECNKAIAALKTADSTLTAYVQVYNAEEGILYSDSLLLLTDLSEEQINNAFEEISEEYICPSQIDRMSEEDVKTAVIIAPDGSNAPFKCDLNRLLQLWWD